MLRTVEMAAADASARGVEIEIVPVDDRENERFAAGAATSVASDLSIIAVIGHKNSGPSKAAAPVYAAAGLAQVTQCSTDNSLSRSGWRTFFRMCAGNERQASVAAEWAHRHHPGVRACAVHDGTDYGRPLVEAFAARLQALSGSPVEIYSMHVGQEDFRELAAEIAGGGFGLVDLGATEIESSKLMIAMRAAGVEAPVMSSEGGPDNPILRLAGAAGEGSVHTYAGSDPSATPASREILRRCQALLGEAPSYMVECYDAVGVIAGALERGAATRAEVRDAIALTDAEGLTGRIRFDSHGDRIDAPVSLWTIRDGRMAPVVGDAAR